MNDKLKYLSPPEKKVAAKVLYRMGWGARKVEEWLGISDDTVLRAAKAPTPKELRQFEAEFELAVQDMKRQGIALVHQRLLELIPRERRIDQVVKAGEYLEGKHSQPSQQANQIVNIQNYIQQIERKRGLKGGEGKK